MLTQEAGLKKRDHFGHINAVQKRNESAEDCRKTGLEFMQDYPGLEGTEEGEFRLQTVY